MLRLLVMTVSSLWARMALATLSGVDPIEKKPLFHFHPGAGALSIATVKAALVANTEEAVARGVFGAQTLFVGEQMFFGQDRLDFVREALA